jgi:hypothetical protein
LVCLFQGLQRPTTNIYKISQTQTYKLFEKISIRAYFVHDSTCKFNKI